MGATTSSPGGEKPKTPPKEKEHVQDVPLGQVAPTTTSGTLVLFTQWQLARETGTRIRLKVNEKTARVVETYKASGKYEAVVKATKSADFTREDVCPIAAEVALRGGQGLAWDDVVEMAAVLRTITAQTSDNVLDDIPAADPQDQYCVCIIAIYNVVNEALQAGTITKNWLRDPESAIGSNWTKFIEYDAASGLKSSVAAIDQEVASFRAGAVPDDVDVAVLAYRDLLKALSTLLPTAAKGQSQPTATTTTTSSSSSATPPKQTVETVTTQTAQAEAPSPQERENLFKNWQFTESGKSGIRLDVPAKTRELVEKFVSDKEKDMAKVNEFLDDVDSVTALDAAPIAAEVALVTGKLAIDWTAITATAQIINKIGPNTVDGDIVAPTVVDDRQAQYVVCLIAIYDELQRAIRAKVRARTWYRGSTAYAYASWKAFVDHDSLGVRQALPSNQRISTVSPFNQGTVKAAAAAEVTVALRAYRDLLKANNVSTQVEQSAEPQPEDVDADVEQPDQPSSAPANPEKASSSSSSSTSEVKPQTTTSAPVVVSKEKSTAPTTAEAVGDVKQPSKPQPGPSPTTKGQSQATTTTSASSSAASSSVTPRKDAQATDEAKKAQVRADALGLVSDPSDDALRIFKNRGLKLNPTRKSNTTFPQDFLTLRPYSPELYNFLDPSKYDPKPGAKDTTEYEARYAAVHEKYKERIAKL